MGIKERKQEQKYIVEEERFNFWTNLILLVVFTVIIGAIAGMSMKGVKIKSFFNFMAFDAFDYYYLNGFLHRAAIFLRNFNFNVFHQNINLFFSQKFFLYFGKSKNMIETATVYKNYIIIIISMLILSRLFFWGVAFKNKTLNKIGYFFDFIFQYSLYRVEKWIFLIMSEIKPETLDDFHLCEREGILGSIKKLINRTYVETDGIERINHIYYMSFFKNIFLKLNNKYGYETRYILSVFKNRYNKKQQIKENEILDLMKIYEADISRVEEEEHIPKNFDIYDKKEYSEKEYQEYKAFQKSRVYFSPFIIEKFINKETENFEKFLNAYLIYGRSFLTIQVAKLRDKIIYSRGWITDMLFAKDEYDKKYLSETSFASNFVNEEYEELKALLDNPNEWWDLFYKKYMKKFLIAHYRFILFYSIMQRYGNMPIGLIIAKIQDYTTRMILDNFKLRAVLFLKPNINDGTGKREEGARNDLLAQIFFYTFNYYEKLKGSIDEKINEKFDVLGMSLNEQIEQIDNEKLFADKENNDESSK